MGLQVETDGVPYKFKGRFCVRGDLQKEGVDFFETYAPVVQWSTVRMLLTFVLANDWVTRQVDYTNVFAQADINEEVYVEPPKDFGSKSGEARVLKLNKSLYGLRQAPRTFFEKLRAGLLERGFRQSNVDHCLFMKRDMVCVVYVDDTIFGGPDPEAIEREIQGLGVSRDVERHTFQLRDEGEVGDFLGIRIAKTGPREFMLTQTGLIDKVLKTSGMNHSTSVRTPAHVTPVGSDKDGAPFDEDWDYAAVIGMLLYLSGNSRPDIAYAVSQCCRFTHNPKASHGVAVKRILRYLQGTRDKGICFRPESHLNVDCS